MDNFENFNLKHLLFILLYLLALAIGFSCLLIFYINQFIVMLAMFLYIDGNDICHLINFKELLLKLLKMDQVFQFWFYLNSLMHQKVIMVV